MFTYGYHVKIKNGPVLDDQQRDMFKKYLIDMLNMPGMYFDPDMGADPSWQFLTEFVTLEEDKCVTGITIHTNMEMNPKYYKSASENIGNAADQAWYDISHDENWEIEAYGDIDILGREGSLPKKLYHITNKNHVDDILKKGLVPEQGENSYKNYENFVYLTDIENLPVWMGIIQNADDAVLLEIDSQNISQIERGRTYLDREYVDSFSEYRTKESIPVKNIKMAVLSENERQQLYETLQQYLANSDECHEEPENAIHVLNRLCEQDFTQAVENITASGNELKQ